VLADERVRACCAGAARTEGVRPRWPDRCRRLRERFVVIRLGDERYGLPIAAVDEVVRLPDTLTRLPKAPAYVSGVMNLRGKRHPGDRPAPALLGRRREGWHPVSSWCHPGALQAGFAVDGVAHPGGRADDLLPAPELSDDGGRLFDRARWSARAKSSC
jgi:purine-binding chemotaxis protein CheW